MVDQGFDLKMTFSLDLPCAWQFEETVQWDGINYNREGLAGSVRSPFLGGCLAFAFRGGGWLFW